MPCLNEVETIPICVEKARSFLARSGVAGEVLIADNGSTDGSVALAERRSVIALRNAARGALMAGMRSTGRFVIMGDADDSYDFAHPDYSLQDCATAATS
jgi:glycosyltransferase involved in cell wall biosynthesis